MKKTTSLLAGVLLAASLNCWANDGIGAENMGNIQLGHTDKVAMAKEVLEISASKISVDYEFLNESASPVHESLVFPLPSYAARSEMDAYYGQPAGFKILVDSQPRPFKTHLLARNEKGLDITEALRKAGLTDDQIAYFPSESSPFRVKGKGLSKHQLALLAKKGLMDSADPDALPLWTVEVTYVWDLTFPPGVPVHVHHQYRPFAEMGVSSNYLKVATLKKDFCADASFIAKWKKVAVDDSATGSRVTPGVFVGYILKTGNTWKDGIRDFTLRVRKESPQALVSLCFPGKASSVDPLTFEFHESNFHPNQDLNIYFGNLPEKALEVDRVGVAPALAK